MRTFHSIFLFTLFLLALSIGHAEVPESNVQVPVVSVEMQAAKNDIAKVLNGPDFNREVTKKSWRFKNKKEMEEDDEVPEWLILFVEFLEEYFSDDSENEKSTLSNIGLLAAKFLEFILWVAGISLLLFMLYYYRDYLKLLAKEMKSSKKASLGKPEVMFGMDIRQESLPENVPEQVLAMWRDGAGRDSLGLLYRATLSRLIHQYDFKFNESATEKECADIVSHSGMKEIDVYIQKLTRIWQKLAYGHHLPGESDVIALCKRWPEIFSSEN